MKRFVKFLLYALGGLLLVGGLTLAILYMLFRPDEKGRIIPLGFEVEPELMSIYRDSLADASDVEFFSGVDRDGSSDLPTFRMHGHHFLKASMTVDPETRSRLIAALRKPGAINEWGGGKLCGGFHPDIAIRWRDAEGEQFEALICLSCHEIKLFGGGERFYADMTGAYGSFDVWYSGITEKAFLEDGIEFYLAFHKIEAGDAVSLRRPIIGSFEEGADVVFRFATAPAGAGWDYHFSPGRLRRNEHEGDSDAFSIVHQLPSKSDVDMFTRYTEFIEELGTPTRLPIGGETQNGWAFDTVWWNLCTPLGADEEMPERNLWQFLKVRVERKYLVDDPTPGYQIVKADIEETVFFELAP